MGTWNASIMGNDTTCDVYNAFFERYNSGQNQIQVSKSIKTDYEDYFQDSDDRNNALIGLALATWETKCLEVELLMEIKEIIASGNDLKLWKDLGADKNTINNRKQELNDFLLKISTPRSKAKRRVRPKFEFSVKEILKVTSKDDRKEFVIKEEFTNGQYLHTSSIITWSSVSGAGIMYYKGEGKEVSARWLNNEVLEIKFDKDVEFHKKEEEVYFFGEEVKIIYKEN